MKNKEITIYELMGLIKDGKAPKRIKYEDIILEYNELVQDYKANYFDDSTDYLLCYLFKSAGALDTKVEILPEENDEWEDIEELAMLYNGNSQDEIMRNRFIINKLIKNQKYLKEKLEDNTCIKAKTELCNLMEEKIEEKLESQRGPFMDEIRIDTPKWIVDHKKLERK